jgi:7-cyano-7-deazaguanine synthase
LKNIMKKKAIVLLSGGLDSATTLALAITQGYAVYALSFNYGQRSLYELQAARRVADSLKVTEHKIIQLDLAGFGGSALTDNGLAVPTSGLTNGIPITYVPARNTVFLALALAWAESLAALDIFIGVNAVDYSGYPDCRPEFISAFTHLANLATKIGIEGQQVQIHAPLIHLDKANIIRTGLALGVDYSLTVSCYQVSETGLACGVCDACRLRRQGFAKANVQDPTPYIKNTF